MPELSQAALQARIKQLMTIDDADLSKWCLFAAASGQLWAMAQRWIGDRLQALAADGTVPLTDCAGLFEAAMAVAAHESSRPFDEQQPVAAFANLERDVRREAELRAGLAIKRGLVADKWQLGPLTAELGKPLVLAGARADVLAALDYLVQQGEQTGIPICRFSRVADTAVAVAGVAKSARSLTNELLRAATDSPLQHQLVVFDDLIAAGDHTGGLSDPPSDTMITIRRVALARGLGVVAGLPLPPDREPARLCDSLRRHNTVHLLLPVESPGLSGERILQCGLTGPQLFIPVPEL